MFCTSTLLEGVNLPADNLFITDNKIEKIYYHSLTTLTKEQRDDGKDYISMMKENLEILKKELYDTE